MVVEFPDVSNWQAGLNLSGARACIAKASEGVHFVDSLFGTFRAWAERLDIPFAGYHWLDGTDPIEQAKFAYAAVGSTVPLMIDVEHVAGLILRVSDVRLFMEAYRAIGGRVTMLYLPRWYWYRMGSPDLTPLRSLALIASDYSTWPNLDPYGGLTPVIHQYTDAHPWGPYAIDMNRFNGTIDELRTVFNGTPTLTPTPEEDDMANANGDWIAQQNGEGGGIVIVRSCRLCCATTWESIGNDNTPVAGWNAAGVPGPFEITSINALGEQVESHSVRHDPDMPNVGGHVADHIHTTMAGRTGPAIIP